MSMHLFLPLCRTKIYICISGKLLQWVGKVSVYHTGTAPRTRTSGIMFIWPCVPPPHIRSPFIPCPPQNGSPFIYMEPPEILRISRTEKKYAYSLFLSRYKYIYIYIYICVYKLYLRRPGFCFKVYIYIYIHVLYYLSLSLPPLMSLFYPHLHTFLFDSFLSCLISFLSLATT